MSVHEAFEDLAQAATVERLDDAGDNPVARALEEVRAENARLRRRLEEAEETIQAIRNGAVDAFVVAEGPEQRVYTLEGADRPYRLLIEEMQQGAATLQADGTILYGNRRLAELLKIPHRNLVGAQLRNFVSTADRQIYDNLLRQGQTRAGGGEAKLRRSDGVLVPAYLTLSALPKQCGADIGILITDLTAQKHHEQLATAESALRASQEQLEAELAATRELHEISSLLIQAGDVHALYRRILDAAIAVMRSDMATIQMLDPARRELRLLAWKGLHPESAAFWEAVSLGSRSSCAKAMEQGGRVVVPDIASCDFIVGTPDCDVFRRSGIRAMQSTPLISRSGHLLGMISTHWREPHAPSEHKLRLFDVLARQTADLIERAQADAALRESETHLRLVLDSAGAGFYGIDPDGTTTTCNAAFVRMLGFDGPEDAIGKNLHGLIHHTHADGSGYPAEECPIYRAARTGQPAHVDHELFYRVDGSSFPVEYWSYPILRDGEIRGAVTTFTDITDRKRNEERQKMLLRELNHRVKNTLTTVQSIALQSFREGQPTEQARQQFEERLLALSKAHDVLTRENWEGAALSTIIREAILPYGGTDDERFSMKGPEVWVPSSYALALSLALHELCTNAIKYGALSNEAGRVTVIWSVGGVDGIPELRIDWIERDGPPVTPPQRRGFGSRLVERGLSQDLNGKTRIEFAPGGVVCTIRAPLERGPGGRST